MPGEELAYLIKAYDTATPVFRAFGEQVTAVTKQVQLSVAEMNKALAAQGKVAATSAEETSAAAAKMKKAQMSTAAATTEASRVEIDASKKAAAAQSAQAAAATRTAEQHSKAAATSAAAYGAAGSTISKFGKNVLLGTAAGAVAFLDLQGKFQANTLRMETQAGASAQQLDKIRQGLIKMAGQVGSTPDQLAAGMYHVVSSLNAVLPAATRTTQELQIMKIAAEGAQVGHSNLEETTYALASALNAMHKNASDAGTVMGQLNAIVGSGDMNMQDLIDSFKSGLIPAANSFGVSLASVGSALAVMGDMGMRGELAGTRLRMALSLMGAPSGQAAKILETLGLNAKEAAARTQAMSALLEKSGVHLTALTHDLRSPNGIQAALVDLNEHLRKSGLTADGAAAAISRAFGGGRMGASITLLSENTGRLGLKFDYINQKAAAFPSDWKLTEESFRLQLDKARAAIEAFGTAMGDKLIPFATSALHALEDTVSWFAKNKLALDLLAGAVISFASIAVGSFLIGRLRAAIKLLSEFRGGLASAAKFAMGGPAPWSKPGAVSYADYKPGTVVGSTGPAGAISKLDTGIVGYMGSKNFVGSMKNPLAVVVSDAGIPGASSKISSTPPPTVVSKAEKAAAMATAEGVVTSKTYTAAEVAMLTGMSKSQVYAQLGAGAISGAQKIEGKWAIPGTALGGSAVSAAEKAAMAAETKAIALEQAIMANPFIGRVGPLPVRPAGGLNEGLVGSSTRPASGFSIMPSPITGGTQAIAAEEAAARTSIMASVKGMASTAMTGLMRGGMIAGMGTMISQMIGDAVGSGTGKALSKIGTGGAVGAGLGSFMGPIGTLIGGGIGAAVGAAFSLFPAKDAGQKLAENFNKGFGDVAKAGIKAALAGGLQADYKKEIDALNKARTPRDKPSKSILQDIGIPVGIQLPNIFGIGGADKQPLTPEQKAQALQHAYAAGLDAAKAFEAGQNSYKFVTEPTMLVQLKQELKGVDPVVQAYAIKHVLTYARQLEDGHKIARGGAQALLEGVKSAFPDFEKYLGLKGVNSVNAFVQGITAPQEGKKITDFLSTIRADISSVDTAISASGKDSQVQWGAAMQSLLSNSIHNTGQIKATANRDLGAMIAFAKTELPQLQSLMKSGSDPGQLSMNMGLAATAVYNSMADANKWTVKGMQSIQGLLSGELKAIGATGPLAGATTPFFQSALKIFTTPKGATGLRVPGSPGPDNYTLLDPLGIPVAMVAGGELLIANRHTEAKQNAINRSVGAPSLGAMVAGESTPHSASVPGYATGGYVFPFPKGEKVGWQRIDQGQDLQGPPGGPVLAVGPGVVSVGIDKFSGFGSSFPIERLTAGPWSGQSIYYGHAKDTRVGKVLAGDVIGVTQSAANTWTAAPAGWLELGFTSALGHGIHDQGAAVAPLLHALATGHMVSSNAGVALAIQSSPAWKAIKSPKWGGPGGMLGTLGQAVLDKYTAAANLFGEAHTGLGGGAGGLPSLVKGPVSSQVDQFFSSKGLNKIAIAGIIGNWMQESSMNPNAPGGGLAQWIGGRGRSLAALAASENQSPSSLAVQLQFAWKELTGPYRAALGAIQSASTAAAAAQSFSNLYEMPGTPAMSNRIRYAQSALAAGYNTGGKVNYAGAFGSGGSVTASSPTMAMFGDNGPETAVFLPHYQTGGILAHEAKLTGSALASFNATHPRDSSGRFVSTTSLHTSTSGGASVTTTTKKLIYTTHFNPLTDEVESHTTAVWNKIHAEHSKQVHDAAAAKKKYDAWLAQQIPTTLMLGGRRITSFDESRKLQQGQFGDVIDSKGRIDLSKNLNELSAKAWKKLLTNLKTGLDAMPLQTEVHMGDALTAAMGRKGSVDRSLLDREARLQRQERADEHPSRPRSIFGSRIAVTRDQLELQRIGQRIASSRPAQEANIAIQSLLTKYTAQFSNQQNELTRKQSIAQMLQALPAGTDYKKLGLSSAQMKASGISKEMITSLAGKEGTVAYVQQLQAQIPKYQDDARRLAGLYQNALKTHNVKLQNALQKQLDAVTQAQIKLYSDIEAAQIDRINAITTKAQNQVAAYQSGSDLIGSIQKMPTWQSVANTGITGAELGTLGLVGLAQPGAAGTLAGAQAMNQPLQAAMAADAAAMQSLQDSIGTLSGDALTTAKNSMGTLAASIINLNDTINNNLITQIQNLASAVTDPAGIMASSTSILSDIENMAPGTNLSALGITPGALSAIGLGSGTSGLEGTSLNYLQGLQTGSTLTPAQIAAAKTGTAAINARLQTQIQTLMGTAGSPDGGGSGLAGELAELPRLSGAPRTAALTTIQNLISSITGLQGTIASNNDAITKLTTATNANTSATGQMTGTVGYTYQGQNYVAGGSFTSDNAANVTLGI